MVLRRLLRKRWVLGVVFGLSLIYFLTSTLKQVQKLTLKKKKVKWCLCDLSKYMRNLLWMTQSDGTLCFWLIQEITLT